MFHRQHHTLRLDVGMVDAIDGNGRFYLHQVVRPRQRHGAVLVVECLVDTVPHVLAVLTLRFTSGTRELSWELPRGGTDGPRDLDGALRELVEETGLVLQHLDWVRAIEPDTGLLDTRVDVWHASVPATTDIIERATTGRTVHVDEETGAPAFWIPRSQLLRQTTCAITLAALAVA